MNKLWTLIPATLCALPAFAIIQVDPAIAFDTAGDFSSNFKTNGSPAYTWSATAGIGGTGGIAGAASDGALTAQQLAGGAFGTGTPQVISAFFKFDDNGQAQAGLSARFGVGTVNSDGASGEYRGVNFQVRNPGFSNEWTPRLRVRGQTVSTGLANVTLTDEHWYRVDASFTILNGAGDFDYTFALYDYGTAGDSLTATVFDHAATVLAANIPGGVGGLDSVNTRYLAFIGTVSDNGYGIVGIDNFGTVAVPEPSTFALLGGLLALGYAVRRRARKAR